MSLICFRCHYCYRVHSTARETLGSEMRCPCGKMMIVPASDATLRTPTGEIPLAHRPDDLAAEDDIPTTLIASEDLDLSPEGGEHGVTDVIAPGAGDTQLIQENGGAALDRLTSSFERESEDGFLLGEPVDTTGSTSMGKGYFIAAAVVFLVWLLHTSPWVYLGVGGKPLPEVFNLLHQGHYGFLERAFWSALLAGLTLSLLGEGYLRRRRA